MITDEMPIDDEDDTAEPRVPLPPLKRWVLGAPLRMKAQLALGTLFALGYAGTTAALANLVHWLSHSSKAGVHAPGPSALQIALIVAVMLRPLFFAAHVHMITGFVGAMASRGGETERNRGSSGVNRRMIALIILTRDAPLVLVLVGMMLVQAGAMGAALAGFVLTGLLLAKQTGKLALSRAPASTCSRTAALIAFRRSRSLSQAAADVPFIVLVLLLVLFRDAYQGLSPGHLTTVALSAMLLGAPTRRLARLFASRGRRAR